MKKFPFTITPSTQEEAFMLEALKEAWKAFQEGEVPIGAVLVKNNRVIARGFNQVEMLKDATAHAEMLCLTAGESELGNWRLLDTCLYSTLEPCTMCAGAILLSRIPEVVWGAPDLRHGAFGSWINILDKPHPMHSLTIKKDVLGDFCASLMREFFQKRRIENEEFF